MMLRPMLVALLAVLCSLVASAQKMERGYFVATLGADTIAVESYELTANGITGNSVTRIPQTTSRTYSMTVGNHGMLENVSIVYGPIDGKSRMTRDFQYWDDSVRVTMVQDTLRRENSAKISGHPYPFVADLFAPWYLAIRNTTKFQRTKEFPMLFGTRVLKYEISVLAPGRLELKNPDFGPIFATLDKNGVLVQFDMTATTDKFAVIRVERLDKEGIVKKFLEREKAGTPFGVPSPRDTVRANINGANIVIDYGRPMVRGRKIFGSVVPWNAVWRLGANAATQFTTDKSLAFGNTIVEPGTYTLFALPSERTWMLIINRQHGQWGTVYDQTKDLLRLPLTIARLPTNVEQFTIAVDSNGDGGVLRFEWENTQASTPLSVR